ncbi:hypothetical protein JCM11251_003837 [Rhodosporidiobolus azoricus]
MEGQADETVHDTDALDNTSVNPVPNTSAEADAYGTDPAPELFPQGVPGTLESGIGLQGTEIPGHEAGEHVMGEDELPVPPPPVGGDGAELQEQVTAEKMDDDEDEDAGDDLFGDGGDDDDEDAAMQEQQPAAASPDQAQQVDEDGLTAEEAAARRKLEYDEDEGGDEDLFGEGGVGAAQHETRDVVQAQVPLANFSVPPDGKVWLARLPGFLQIAPNPYDEGTWQPEDGEDEKPVEEEEGSQSQGDVKPKINGGRGRVPDENVVRWRWTKNELQQVIKQSNARIVRWSDGTLSLQLGSELFDLTLALDHSAVVSSALPVPPTQNPAASLTPTTFDSARAHGLTYLTARHAYNGHMFEAQASIYGTIGMRPAALTSRTHKKLAGAIASRNALNKGKSTIKFTATQDPERARAEREKKEAERAKKAQREARKAAGGGRRGGGRKGGKKATTIEGLSDEEEGDGGDSDEEGGGYSERRSQPRRGRGGPFSRNYSDDEEDDGFVAKSDDDMGVSDADPEEIEEADDAIERDEARRRKDRSKKQQRDVSSSPEPEKEEAGAAPRRRLVVESDEDE